MDKSKTRAIYYIYNNSLKSLNYLYASIASINRHIVQKQAIVF